MAKFFLRQILTVLFLCFVLTQNIFAYSIPKDDLKESNYRSIYIAPRNTANKPKSNENLIKTKKLATSENQTNTSIDSQRMKIVQSPEQQLTLKQKLKMIEAKQTHQSDHFIFDLPVTYNKKVATWISFFQTRGKNFFRDWLEKSHKYMPLIQSELKKAGLPTDLAYMVMIESGFQANAISHASAVGPWQFISSTGKNYGLQQNWWLDERRDIRKSTQAAIRYMQDLKKEFGSWYLVAASYNMGEGGLRRQIKRYKTNDYWELVKFRALPQETQDYVPKILAALMIAKAPNLYGFRNIDAHYPLQYEVVWAPGGTDLENLADYLNVTRNSMKELNAELILGYIPKQAQGHPIRIPLGSLSVAKQFFRDQNKKYALD